MNKNEKNEKNEKRKKRMLFLVFGLIGIAILVQGTYAWFINMQRKANRFTTGEIKHEILENFNKAGASQDLLPGETVNKDVFIHNLGKSDALVRVKVSPVWVDSNGATTPADNEVELIFPTDFSTNWLKGADGKYYYRFILEKHKSSSGHQTEGNVTSNINNTLKCYSKQLLDAIKLKPTVTDQAKFAGKTLDVVVESEAIQVNLAAAKSEWNIQNDKQVLDLITNLVNSYKK